MMAMAPRRKGLPGTVISAGVIMSLIGALSILVLVMGAVDPVEFPGVMGAPLWIVVLSYLVAGLNVLAPVFMLARRSWAYSVSVSILLGNSITSYLALGDLVFLGPEAWVVILVYGAILGVTVLLPLLLLMSRSARTAFESGRSWSALVWGGGGWTRPGDQPFALHPDEVRHFFKEHPFLLPFALPGAWGLPGFGLQPAGYPPMLPGPQHGGVPAQQPFGPQAYGPQAYGPQAYGPQAYGPQAYGPEPPYPQPPYPQPQYPPAQYPQPYGPPPYGPQAYGPQPEYGPPVYGPQPPYGPQAPYPPPYYGQPPYGPGFW